MIRLLATCVSAAERAGRIIREVAQEGKLNVVDKSLREYQTEADRRAQRCIVSTLASRFPDITIVAEEELPPSEEDSRLIVDEVDEDILKEKCPDQLSNVQQKDIVLWVDPLDATNEFINGLYEYVTVLIGIAVQGTPVGGVVHQPFWNPNQSPSSNGRTAWGLVGLGVRVSPPLALDGPNIGCSLVVTWPPYSNEDQLQKTIESVKPTSVIEAGGAEVFFLLEGRAHAHVMVGLMSQKWDMCAGEGLLRAAGGVATDIHGDALSYWADSACRECICGFIGSLDVELHRQILAQVPQSVKETLRSRRSE